MMKAVVLEIRGGDAAILARDGTVRIVRGSYRVGDVIEYEPAPRVRLRRWAAAAAAAIAAIGITAGLWVDRNYIAYAEVSLDVNPSIVYAVNKRDRVLSVRAANEDGADIVERLRREDIRFATLSDAVGRTLSLLEDEGYLAEDTDDYVLVNVSADDEGRQDRLIEKVESAMTQTMERDATLEYRIDRSDRGTARVAEDSGMSTGRYAAWQQSDGEGGDHDGPSLDEYATKPVREIMEKGSSVSDDPARNSHTPDSPSRDEPDPERQKPEADANAPSSGEGKGEDEAGGAPAAPPEDADRREGAGEDPADPAKPQEEAAPHTGEDDSVKPEQPHEASDPSDQGEQKGQSRQPADKPADKDRGKKESAGERKQDPSGGKRKGSGGGKTGPGHR